MPEILIEIISAASIILLIFGLIYATMLFLIWNNFRKIQNEFGGEFSFKGFKSVFSLKGINVSFIIGTPYTVGGTIFKVATLPKAPIEVRLSSSKRFFNTRNQFNHAFSSEQVILNNYKSLSTEVEKFKSEMRSNRSSLILNPSEFSLATEYSPFFFQKIKSCFNRLLKLRDTINQIEQNEGL